MTKQHEPETAKRLSDNQMEAFIVNDGKAVVDAFQQFLQHCRDNGMNHRLDLMDVTSELLSHLAMNAMADVVNPDCACADCYRAAWNGIAVDLAQAINFHIQHYARPKAREAVQNAQSSFSLQ